MVSISLVDFLTSKSRISSPQMSLAASSAPGAKVPIDSRRASTAYASREAHLRQQSSLLPSRGIQRRRSAATASKNVSTVGPLLLISLAERPSWVLHLWETAWTLSCRTVALFPLPLKFCTMRLGWARLVSVMPVVAVPNCPRPYVPWLMSPWVISRPSPPLPMVPPARAPPPTAPIPRPLVSDRPLLVCPAEVMPPLEA